MFVVASKQAFGCAGSDGGVDAGPGVGVEVGGLEGWDVINTSVPIVEVQVQE